MGKKSYSRSNELLKRSEGLLSNINRSLARLNFQTLAQSPYRLRLR
jgi:hypothetical protein